LVDFVFDWIVKSGRRRHDDERRGTNDETNDEADDEQSDKGRDERKRG
jgi:hypothetical protein